VPLLIIDDFGMRKLPHTAGAGKLLGDVAARSAPRSIGCCITAMCSSAVRVVGGRKQPQLRVDDNRRGPAILKAPASKYLSSVQQDLG